MNVGSILNGDSPQDAAANSSKISDVDKEDNESRGSRPSMPEVVHRQSINNLLNDAPAGGAKAVVTRQDSNDSQVSAVPDFPEKFGESGKTGSSGPKNVYSKDDEGDFDDVDADAERIDRELAEASLNETKTTAESSKTPEKTEKTEKTDHLGSPKTVGNPEPSRRAFLSGELEKLQKLKGEKKKPTRYVEPPVWAQEWVPPSQQGNHGYSETPAASSGISRDSAVSSKSVFSREAMVSADLECSITGVIPPQSTVRTIAEWLYANFVEISLENRQHVELELKFGNIISKDSGTRIDIGVSTECIFTNTSNTRFEMGVHQVGWNEMKAFLDELEKNYAELVRRDQTKPRRKFSLTESNNTDYFYSITERNEKPKKIRVSKDNSLNPPRYVAISKRRVSDLYIHNPSSMYDLRLSLSIEFPVDEDSIEPIMKKNKPSLQRGKKRASYSHAPTVTRFDFTEVSVPRAAKNKAGRAVTENEKSYELELEIDTFQIFRGFDRVRDGSDAIRFEELVEIFLNNARCLNNRVTKLASK